MTADLQDIMVCNLVDHTRHGPDTAHNTTKKRLHTSRDYVHRKNNLQIMGCVGSQKICHIQLN